MGPVWKKQVYGTPDGDKVQYNLKTFRTGDLVTSSRWAELKDLIVQERKRRQLQTNSIFTAEQSKNIVAWGRNNLAQLADIDNLGYSTVTTNNVVSHLDMIEIQEKVKKSGLVCVCNCDYCTCNCNYCICNCDYSCTCNCAYCTCDCNFCTCNCNYSCTCNCNYR